MSFSLLLVNSLQSDDMSGQTTNVIVTCSCDEILGELANSAVESLGELARSATETDLTSTLATPRKHRAHGPPNEH